MLPAQPNQSLIDGVRCLQAVATAGVPIGGRELARRLEMEPTRANRLLKTLAAQGFLHQDGDRKYQPGAGMHVLAAQSLHGSGMLQRALPVLARLRRRRPALIVALGVLWHDQVSYLYHADPQTPPHQAIGRLGAYPASISSIGMALLATRDDAEIRDLYRGRIIPGHPEGLGSLMGAIRTARRRGFAHVVESENPPHSTLAVTVGVPAEAAIAFAGHSLFPDAETLAVLLRQASLEITPPTTG